MGIALLGVIIIFIPGIIGMDGFDGGYAISVGGGFVFMVGIIAAVIYFKLAKSADTIIRNENVLAHWTYSPEQWRQYTEEEHKEDAAAKWGLFVLVAVIAVVVGIIMAIMIGEDFLIIALIILGIIAVAGLAALFSTIGSYLYNKKYHGEAYLTQDGVYFNKQMHIWKGMGNKLESIAFDKEDRELPRLTIVYSALAAYKRNSYAVRIPVPPGEETTAKMIVNKIGQTHLKGCGSDI
jgi:hypothetical protein